MKKLIACLFGLLFAGNLYAANLPSGYTELEYIDTDGESWIDTGITPTATTLQFDYKMQILQQGYVSLFGAVAASNPRKGFRVYYQPADTTNQLNWQSGSFGAQQYVTWNDVLQGTVIATQGVSIVSTINGTTQTYSGATIDLTQSDTIFLGTAHLGTTSGRGPTRTWSFKITKDGTVVFDGVPARNSAGVIGIYNLVDSNPATAFHTNKGTGEFTGGPDVVQPAATQSNCNLFNDVMESGTITGTGVNSSSSVRVRTANFTSVNPNTTYTLSAKITDKIKMAYIFYYTNEGTFIERKNLANLPYTFTTTANTGKVRFILTESNNGVDVVPSDAQDIKLERGSTVTPYRAYDAACLDAGCHNYTTATGTSTQTSTPSPENPVPIVDYTQGNIVLRAVGDYKDTYDASTGIITRRVGVVVFNGTENWRNYTGGNSVYTDVSARRNISEGLSSHYKIDTRSGVNNSIWPSNGSNSIILTDSQHATSADAFKTWLSQNPVTFYYPLKTEITEYVGTQWCEGIKIATTKYNNTAFSGVVTALSNAVDTIKTVVANTITQATAVANLHSGKQTKPTDTCPNGKICLLVEDEQGTPHWYEIIERAPGIVPAGSGYTQVAYLQSDGNQYIDTGFEPNVNSGMVLDFESNRSDVPSQALVSAGTTSFGVASNSSVQANDFLVYNGISNDATFYWRLDNAYGDGTGRYLLTIDKQSFSIKASNGATYSATFSNAAYTMGYNLVLFGKNAAGTKTGSKVKIYSAQLYDDGVMVRDFVPARRNSDGVLGMYDTVSGNFFTNAGTGSFTTNRLPVGYTELQYLQGGRKDNAYIDLGYAATSTMQTLLQASIVERNSGDNLLFGSANGDSFSNSDPYAIDVFPTNVLLPAGAFEGGGTDVYKINVSNEIGQVYQYKIHYSTVGQIGVDDTVKTIPTKTVNDRHLYLFGFGGKENQYVGNYCVPVMRAYRLTQWDNGVMIHDFIPAQNSSGTLGMYDLMDTNPSTAFHTNAGTGTFTAGPVMQ